jgi:hypothetical protein
VCVFYYEIFLYSLSNEVTFGDRTPRKKNMFVMFGKKSHNVSICLVSCDFVTLAERGIIPTTFSVHVPVLQLLFPIPCESKKDDPVASSLKHCRCHAQHSIPG